MTIHIHVYELIVAPYAVGEVRIEQWINGILTNHTSIIQYPLLRPVFDDLGQRSDSVIHLHVSLDQAGIL